MPGDRKDLHRSAIQIAGLPEDAGIFERIPVACHSLTPILRRSFLRQVACLAVALPFGIAHADQLLLVPLDSRPAAGQFAQMIGRIGGIHVRMPPYDALGRFTTPGQPERILAWLDTMARGGATTAVVSLDMVVYGGLIAGREPTVPIHIAQTRLRRLVDIKKRHPELRLFVFSATMRVAPTSKRRNAAWRDHLAAFFEFSDRFRRTGEPEVGARAARLRARIPEAELRRYIAARTRNHSIQRSAIEFTARGVFDYLVIGQDDARPFGPFIAETEAMRRLVQKRHVGGRVYFAEGIDQHAAVLVSRAILKAHDYTPRVRIVWSDEEARKLLADYESKPIEDSLRDQIFASGARPVLGTDPSDYTLYVNAPTKNRDSRLAFLNQMGADIDAGVPVAVADIDLGPDGTVDPDLFTSLEANSRMFNLIAYAGWNTAGNTMGTAIPAANVYMLAQTLAVNPLDRELAQKAFLLHRLVNDFAYHRITRPQAYALIDAERESREEVYGEPLAVVNHFVQKDLGKQLERTFRDQFLGRAFFAGNRMYSLSGLTNVGIFLPWPRAFEVRLQFDLQASPVVVHADTTQTAMRN